MESSPYVDGTIALFKRLRAESDKVGIAIQAYLFRTEKDIEEPRAARRGDSAREGRVSRAAPTSRIPNKADVDANYFKLASRLLQDDATRPGALLHIATHDIALQERLQQVIAERKIPHEPLRVRDALRHPDRRASRQLGKQGLRTRCLISYGEYWFPWYMRRLAERPANVWFVVEEHVQIIVVRRITFS